MHVIYIHTHDSGRYFRPYGYEIPSFAIQAFAEDALLFTNAYCTNPTCSPSRASLLTGTYPHQNGMLGLAQRGFALNDYDKHLCRYLHRNGYHSVLCGIQHEVDYYLNVEASAALGYDEVLTQPAAGIAKEELHHWDDANVKALCAWIDAYEGDQPCFISYGMHSTHRPFPVEIDESVDERYVKPADPLVNDAVTRHDFAQYLTSAKHADECFAQLMEALKRKGWYEDAIILFTTDHGVAFPMSKCTLSDRGIGVSLLMRVPHAKANGTISDALLSQVDVFPTLCDLLGLKKPEYLEGTSFAKLFDAEPIEDHPVFAEINFHTSYEPVRCVRTRRYKYVRYYDETHLCTNPSNTDSSPSKTFYVEHDYVTQTKPQEALYDLYYDPQESDNRIADPAYAQIADELRAKLEEFQQQTKDPLLQGPLPILSHYKVNRPECMDASSKNPDDYMEEGTFY